MARVSALLGTFLIFVSMALYIAACATPELYTWTSTDHHLGMFRECYDSECFEIEKDCSRGFIDPITGKTKLLPYCRQFNAIRAFAVIAIFSMALSFILAVSNLLRRKPGVVGAETPLQPAAAQSQKVATPGYLAIALGIFGSAVCGVISMANVLDYHASTYGASTVLLIAACVLGLIGSIVYAIGIKSDTD